MKRLAILACLFVSPALAQQTDPAKLAPLYRQQRDYANAQAADNAAACAMTVSDLQAKIAELEKKLAEAQPK